MSVSARGSAPARARPHNASARAKAHARHRRTVNRGPWRGWAHPAGPRCGWVLSGRRGTPTTGPGNGAPCATHARTVIPSLGPPAPNDAPPPPPRSPATDCAPGYGMVNGSCVACAVGFFLASSGKDACTACPANLKTPATGSTTNASCTGAPARARQARHPWGGRTSTVGAAGRAPCAHANGHPAHDDKESSVVDLAGPYSWHPAARCSGQICPGYPGKCYLIMGAPPPHKFLAVCMPGYGGPDCTQCAIGSWSAGGNSSVQKPACTSCPATAAATKNVGATSAAECTCAPAALRASQCGASLGLPGNCGIRSTPVPVLCTWFESGRVLGGGFRATP